MSGGGNSLSLSFLDVLSCSLGASILLFLIFSALEHEGDRSSQADTGLPIEATVMAVGEPAPEVTKTPALLSVVVRRDAPGDELPDMTGEGTGWSIAWERTQRTDLRLERRFLLFVQDRTEEISVKFPDAGRVRVDIRQVGGGRDGEVNTFEFSGKQTLTYRAGSWEGAG